MGLRLFSVGRSFLVEPPTAMMQTWGGVEEEGFYEHQYT